MSGFLFLHSLISSLTGSMIEKNVCFMDLRSLLLPPCLTFISALLELGSPADSVFSGRVIFGFG